MLHQATILEQIAEDMERYGPASDDRDNALERVVEYHGDQRIQVAKLNLTVPAPRDLDAEVEIEVDEDKVEVAETEDEDDMGARLQKQFEDGLITFDEAMARTTAQ